MSNRFEVLSYNEDMNYHLCQDENGRQHRVDLLVSGKLPEETTPESLVGQTVEYEYTHPFIVIAEGVSLIPPNAEAQRSPASGDKLPPLVRPFGGQS